MMIITNNYDEKMQWRQDILHLNKLYSKHH